MANKTLTRDELLRSLYFAKESFHVSGCENNLLMSLTYVIRNGLMDFISDKEVVVVFGDIFICSDKTKSMNARLALVSAIRNSFKPGDKSGVNKKIAHALIAFHPDVLPQSTLGTFVKQIVSFKGSLDEYIRENNLTPV